MNHSELAIAYSPESEVLDDVIRTAVTNLIVENIRDLLPIIIEIIPDFPIDEVPPDLINFNSTAIIDYIKSRIRVIPYKNSTVIRGVFINEETTRQVIAAVEFDDRLHGQY